MSMMAERDMGRILLDLSDDVIQRLDDLKVQRNIPRAELLREAVEQYLENISQDIAERSVALRQEYKLKLPDAIILATAQLHRLELITRNTKDFAGIPGVATPYEIHPE